MLPGSVRDPGSTVLPQSVTLAFRSDSQRKQPRLNVLGRVLVEADDVSARIAEPRCNFGRIRADRLNDLAAMGYHRINGRSYAVHHDVNKEPGLSGGRAPQHPSAAHLAGGIVKSSAAIAAFPDGPAEDAFVEAGRTRNVAGGHLDVTNLSVHKRGRHQDSFPGAAILAALKLKSIPRRWVARRND